MRKFSFFLILFTFLAGLGWGQTTYTYNGWTGAPWNNTAIWTPTGYPVDGDSVIFPTADGAAIPDGLNLNEVTVSYNGQYQLTVAAGGTVTIEKLTVAAGTTLQPLGVSSNLHVKDLILNGTINNTTSGYSLVVENIEIGSNANIQSSPISMGNGTTVAIVNGNITVNVPNNSGTVILGNITTGSTGNVTVNTGTGNNITINDINAGGNVTISFPPGSTSTVIVPPGIPGIDYTDPKITADSGDASTGDPSTYNGQHIVYGLNNPFGSDASYFFINSNQYPLIVLPPPFAGTPVANREIYLVDVHTHTGSLTVTTDGFIEIRGNYTSNAALTLNPGTSGIKLNDAHITITGTGINFIAAQRIELTGSTGSSISVNNANIELGNGSAAEQGIYGNGKNLTLTGSLITLRGGTAILQNNMNVSPPSGTNIGILDITGNASFPNVASYPASAFTAGTVRVSGNARIFGHISTGTGTQNYGSITLDVADTANANVAYRYLAGSTITIGTLGSSDAINCGGHDFRINGNAVFNLIINNARRMNVTGTAQINRNINASTNGTDASDGNLTFGQAVTLGASVTITGRGTGANQTGSIISFGGAVNGSYTLAIANANAVFAEAVGGGGTALTGLSVAGTTTINNNITTNGAQTYTGNVLLGNNITFSAGAAANTVTFGGMVNSTSASAPRQIIFTTSAVTFNGIVGNADDITSIDVNSGTARINANITTVGNRGTATTGNSSFSGQDYRGEVIIGNNVTLTAKNTRRVVFRNAVTGANNLTIDGILWFRNAANVTPIVNGLSLIRVTGNTLFTNSTALNTTGPQEYEGEVILDAAAGTAVNMTFNAGGIANTVRFRNVVRSTVNTGTRTLQINNAGARFDGNVGGAGQIISVLTIGQTNPGTAVINADITTTGNQVYNGAATLANLSTLLSSGGSITTTGNVSAVNGINITANGITVTGGINSNTVTTGVITLTTSQNANVTVNGSIYGERLVINAGTGNVTVGANAALNVSSNGNHSTAPSDGKGAAIYIEANVFTLSANSGTENVIPGTTGLLCVEADTFYHNNRVSGKRYHYHKGVPANTHLVYCNHSTIVNVPNPYFVINPSDPIHDFTLSPGYNVYIYDATSAANVSFTTSGTGFVELRGNNVLTHVITFSPANPNLHLNDTNSSFGANSFNYGIILAGTTNRASSITAASISLGAVTASTGVNDLTLEATGTGNVTFGTAIVNGIIRNLTVNTGTGTTNINVNIATSGTQTYNGSVTLGGAAALTGTTVTLGTITGNYSLTITGNGVFNGGSGIGALSVSQTATFQTGNLSAASVSVTGTSSIGVDITTSGTQTYTGAVTLGGAATLTGTTVSLGTITGASHPLTITGSGVFHGGSGIGALSVTANAVFQTAVLSAASVSVTGTSEIDVNITTTGGTQTYTGAVTLGGAAGTRTLLGTTVTLGPITGANHPLTITGSGVFNGGSGIGALSVTVNAAFQTAALSAASVSVTGTSAIDVNITTTGGTQTYTGAVTLGGATGTPRILTGTTVTLGGITGAGRSLTITGSGVFTNGGTGIGALIVSTNATFQNADLNAASVSVIGTSAVNVDITTTGGTQTYTGAVTLGGAANALRTLTGTTVSLGSITGANHPLTITGSGAFHGGSGIGALSVTANATFQTAALSAASVSVTGTSAIDVNITTTGGTQTYTGAVTLGGAANALRTLTGTTVTLGPITGVNHPLTITGSGVFNGGSGIEALSVSQTATFQNTDLNAASVSVTGTSTINVDITTSGTQTYTGAVTLGGAAGALRTLAGTTVTLGTITGASHPLTITGSGVFNGGSGIGALSVSVNAVFQTAALSAASVSVAGTSTINVNITTPGTATGNQYYSGPVTLGLGTRELTAGGTFTTGTGVVGGTSALTVIAGGLITIGSGGINLSNSVILQTGGNIILNGGITAQNIALSANTTGGTVTLNSGNIVATGNLISTGCPTNISNVTICITAYTFTVNTVNNPTINPGANNELCLHVDNIPANLHTSSIVTSNHYHTHLADVYAHLIYIDLSNLANTLPNNIYPRSIINSSDTTDTRTSFTVRSTFNIYIINTGNTASARDLTFQTDTGGLIEFRGTVTMNTIVMNALPTPANNANVNLSIAHITTSSDFNTSGSVTLVGASNQSNTINAASVTLGAITGGGSSLTLNSAGAINLAGGSNILNLTVGSSGTTANTTLSGSISSTGNQTYNGPVILANNITLSGDGSVNHLVNFLSTVNSPTTNSLTVTDTNVRFGAGAGTTTPIIGSISVTGGNTTINGNITTSGAQNYGTVTLEGSSANRELTGSTVTLGAIAGGGNNLEIHGTGSNNANAVFNGGTQIRALVVNGAAAFNTTLLEALSIEVIGSSAINANISTTGNQTYNGTVTFGGTGNLRTITSTGGSQSYKNTVTLNNNVNLTGTLTYPTLIHFENIVNGSNTLTVTNANVRFDNTVGGTTSLSSINITAGESVINTTGIRTSGNQTYGGAVRLMRDAVFTGVNTGALIHFENTVNSFDTDDHSLTINVSIAQFDRNVGAAATPITSVNVSTAARINADVTTVNEQLYSGTVTLGGTAGTANPRTLSGTTVTLGSINMLDTNARSLTVNAATSTLNGGTGIGALIINGNAAFRTGSVNAMSVEVRGTANTSNFYTNANIITSGANPNSFQTYQGPVILNAAISFIGIQGSLIDFQNVINGAYTLNVITAHVRFGNNVGQTTPLTGINVTSGETRIYASNIITSFGGQTYNGPVLLRNNSITFRGNPGTTVHFDDIISTDANTRSITITDANVRFNGNVGASSVANRLDSITVSSGSAVFNQGIGVFTRNNQTYNNLINLINVNGAVITLDSSGNGGNIIFSYNAAAPAVTGTGNLTMNAGIGNINIAGQVGTDASNRIGNFSVINAATVNVGGNMFTNNITITAGSVDMQNVTANNISIDGISIVTIKDINSNNMDVSADTVSLQQVTANNAVIESSLLYTQHGKVTARSIKQTIGTGSGTGSISLWNDIEVTEFISLAGEVTLFSNVVFSTPSTGGYLELNRLNDNGNIFSLSGGRANTPFDIKQIYGTSEIFFNGDIIIFTNSFLRLANNVIVRQFDGKKLTLMRGTGVLNTTLDVSAGAWYMGGTVTGNSAFAGINGTLILEGSSTRTLPLTQSSNLIVNDLRLTGNSGSGDKFRIFNTASGDVSWAAVSIRGNADIAGGSDVIFNPASDDTPITERLPYLILNIIGSVKQELRTAQHLGSLHVGEYSNVELISTDSANLQTIFFRGEVVILSLSSPAGLDAGDHDIVMYAGITGYRNTSDYLHSGTDVINYTRWETRINIINTNMEPPFTVTPNMNDFIFRQGTGRMVSFKRAPDYAATLPVFFEVAGNSMWRELECRVPGAIVQFSRDPDHHTILESFSMQGEGDESNVDYSKYVTITRLTEGSYSQYPYEFDPGKMMYPASNPPDSNIGELGQWALPVYYPPMNLKDVGDGERGKYWNINLVSSPRLLNLFKYVRIFFSHAYHQRIPIEPRAMCLAVIPYYNPNSSPAVGYFNYDWIELKKILYSFTEDGNGNGRLDRIRVQTNLSLNGMFYIDNENRFDVSVEGYEINRSLGQNGYQLVSEVTGTTFDNDSFYIYLIEHEDIDGGNTPLWSVTFNNTLKDIMTQTSLVGDELDVNIRPFDTIPPRIAYTLTLPERRETYIRMSELITSASGVFSGNGLNLAQGVGLIDESAPHPFYWEELDGDPPHSMIVPGGSLGFMLPWTNYFTVSELAGLADIKDTPDALADGYFIADGFVDQSQRAMDYSDPFLNALDYIYYQPPKYPLDWGYSAYAKVNGNGHLRQDNILFMDDVQLAATGASPGVPIEDVFIPPYRLLTSDMMVLLQQNRGSEVMPSSFSSSTEVIRRVTDALVSVPPNANDSGNYFAWPIWARYQRQSSLPGAFSTSDFWGNLPTDTGIIWIFDGTYYLEAENVELQVRVNSSAFPSQSPGVEFLWSTSVGSAYRNPHAAPERGRNTGGLWIPFNIFGTNPPLYYLAPHFDSTAPHYANIGRLLPSNSIAGISYPFFNFRLNQNTSPGYDSGQKIEFVLRFTDRVTDLFIARLDIPHGSVIPNDWYAHVRPFGFDIQNMRTQRGGVTILNNVINSNNRENTYVRYVLSRPGRVTIQVYTLDGTLIRSIRRNEIRAAGEWTDAWDGTNNGGRPVARGMYFIRVVAPDIDEIRKVMVIR